MLLAIVISVGVAISLLVSMRSSKKGGLITYTPYNNTQNDATAARDDHLG